MPLNPALPSLAEKSFPSAPSFTVMHPGTPLMESHVRDWPGASGDGIVSRASAMETVYVRTLDIGDIVTVSVYLPSVYRSSRTANPETPSAGDSCNKI